MTVDNKATRRNNQEDLKVTQHRCENPKPYSHTGKGKAIPLQAWTGP